MTENTIAYRDCIEEAFIEPIRSVTIVDDEYPTLDFLLEQTQVDIANKDSESLKKIINMCRSDEKSWSLDVYDGKPLPLKPNGNIPPHINQSDFLILDYHLQDEGEKARKILNLLAENNHYNLVVVHTHGVDDSTEKVYEDILKDFLSLPIIDFPDIKNKQSKKTKEEVNDIISDYLDDNDQVREIIDTPISFLSLLPFIEKKTITNHNIPQNPLNITFQDEIKKISNGCNLSPEYILWWVISKTLEKESSIFEEKTTKIDNYFYTDDKNWIATDKIFLTVIKKSSDENFAENLITSLINAIEGYRPSPMLLLMSRMRYELDESGVENALKIINDKYTQAGWLHEFISTNTLEEESCIKTINNHWKLIANSTQGNLVKFSNQLFSSLKNIGNNKKEILTYFYKKEILSRDKEITASINAYNCSKLIEKNHLTTGHIISHIINEDIHYWICLSPACDMVPGQNEKSWQRNIGTTYKPFKAVKLTKLSLSTVFSKDKDGNYKHNIQENNFIFLKLNSGIICLRYPRFTDTPEWELMLAGNNGNISNDYNIDIIRIASSENNYPDIQKTSSFRVVGELRYEYALNLLQRFGTSQTRVGLDFINHITM